MKKSRLLAGLVFAALTSTANAGLLGDSVGINFHSFSPGYDSGLQSVTVGAGEEGNFFFNQYYDFSDSSFKIRTTQTFCGIASCTSTDTMSLQLTSLDFGSPLSGVSVSTTLSGVSTTFGADWVTFTWNEQTLNPTTYLSAEFSTTPVPEPETYAMLLAGLGLLGFAARRRKLKLAA